jgi:hypothetical protein
VFSRLYHHIPDKLARRYPVQAGVEVFADRSFEASIGARYGAFPTERTWFVSGGRWPSSELEEADEGGLHFLSQNVFVKKNATAANGEHVYGFVDQNEIKSQHRRAQDTSNPFTAGIARSLDQGATWQTVFETDSAGYCALTASILPHTLPYVAHF